MNNIFLRIVFLIYAVLGFIDAVIVAQSTIYKSNLDSIVVSVNRKSAEINSIPFSVSIIDSIQLKNITNSLSLKDVLSTAPGVVVNNRVNQAQGDKILIRGIGSRAQFGVRGIKILLDDIPLTFPDGQSQLNNLNISSISKIEILNGPASALYGNSSGGVIDIKSNSSGTISNKIKASIENGSFGFTKFNLDLSGNILSTNSSLNIYSTSNKGYRQHSDSKSYGANFSTRANISNKLNFTFLLNYIHSPFLLNPSSLNKTDAENNPTKVRDIIIESGSSKKVDQTQSGITVNYNFNANSKIKSTFFLISRNLQNAIPSRIIELDRMSYGIRTTFEQKFSSLDITSGFDFELQDDERKEFKNMGVNDSWLGDPSDLLDNLGYGEKILDQNEFVSGLGIFINLDYRVNNYILLNGGMRYDSYHFSVKEKFEQQFTTVDKRKDMDNFSPIVGINIKATDHFNIYGNYSTSFQTPTTNELSNTESGSGGFNNKLQPEKINTIEAGIKAEFLPVDLYFTAAFYYMNIYNQLISNQNQFEETYYTNSGKSNNTGLELSLNWKPISKGFLSVNYSHNNMKFQDYVIDINSESYQLAGNYVPGVPKHNLGFKIGAQLPYGFSTQFNINIQSKVYTNDFNGPYPGIKRPQSEYINDEYILCNYMLSYSNQFSFGELKIKAGIENFFNTRYNGSVVVNAFYRNYFEPGSSRAYFTSLSYLLP
jgi:iron complex outermembrane recepter protein